MVPPLDALATVLSGGITGVLGAIISRISDYLVERQKNEHQLSLTRIHLESMDKELQNKIMELEAISKFSHQLPKPVEELAYTHSAINESFKETSKKLSKSSSKWFVLVDVVRGVIRPALTMFLCLMCFVIWMYSKDGSLREQVVLTILYMSTTATLWWFGTRHVNSEK